MQGKYLIIVGVLAILGAILFNKFYLSKKASEGPTASGQTFPFGSVTEIEPGQSPSANINFSQTGNLVKKDGKWVLVYEQPGNPAVTVNLVFTGSSVCDFEKGGSCDESLFTSGQRVRVDGNREGDTVMVVGITQTSPASPSY